MRLDRAVRFVWQAGSKWMLCLGAFLLVQGFLPLATLYLMKLIVDSVTEAMAAPDTAGTFNDVIFYVALAAGVALVQALVQALSGPIRQGLSLTVGDRMYDLLHAKSIAVDLDYYEDPRYFDTLHRAQREGPSRPIRIVDTLMTLGRDGISLLAVTGLLLSFHWGVTVVLLFTALPGIFIRIKFSRELFHWQRNRTPEERKTMYYSWILTGNAHAKEVRLFGLGGEISGRFSELRRKLRHEKLSIARRQAFAEFFTQAAGRVAVFATLGVIAYRAVLGAITLGDMVMFYQAFQRGLGYLRSVLGGLADLYENNLFLLNLYEFLDFEPRIKDPENPLPVPHTAEKGFEFQHVWFRYPQTDRMVLRDVSFAVRPGEVVALVGENGSGKTTLIKLLCRLYDPVDGRITLEGAPLHRFAAAELRREISVIFQDFVQYHLTAEDNIRFGNINGRGATLDHIREAARRSGAHPVIEDLPEGYGTILGKLFKDGVELSIGQWQMVALARAFLRRGRLIVLDEPTSSLDPNSEYEVFSRFRALLEGKSAILISHRFSTVRMADRIVVLKDGGIAETGSHEELMAGQGYYAGLFQKQAACYQCL